MDSGPRWLLIVAIVVLGLAECGWIGYRTEMRMQADLRASVLLYHRPLPKTAVRRFSHAQVSQFLGRAKQAEAIADPLQRCLAYPDPPASHWSHDAVSAYCNYSYQTVISYADVQQLIQSGHAAEVDRRLAQALLQQSTLPSAQGRLDRTFFQDFYSSSPDVRATLDAWKRESPNSAFAYAASGVVYMNMAAKARGNAYISDTSHSQLDSMDGLLSQAEADLRRALALNPKVTPAYSALIEVGRMGRSRAFIDDVARRGLAAAPADYSIYSTLMDADQPKWGGSLSAMEGLASRAQMHARDNPLLLLLASEPAYEYDVCNCKSSAVWAADPTVFDDVANYNLLLQAGSAAERNKHPNLAVVYLTEGLRFSPNNIEERAHRNYYLTDFGESTWALADASLMIKDWPKKADGFDARAYAYESIKDYAHAEEDLRMAIPLDTENLWPLIELGDIYVYKTHDWDKGWDVANQLIQAHPEKPQGWVLRASIQKDQPRAGMDDTVHYFLAHFGNDPDERVPVRQMRAALAEEAKAAGHVVSATAPSGS